MHQNSYFNIVYILQTIQQMLTYKTSSSSNSYNTHNYKIFIFSFDLNTHNYTFISLINIIRVSISILKYKNSMLEYSVELILNRKSSILEDLLKDLTI